MSEEPLAAAPSESRYPIVSSQPMAAARRSGPLNIFGPRRSPHEMVRIDQGHYAIVYRVDGRFVRDDSQDWRSDVAVRATHVSVVDVRRNAPVTIRLKIPAQQSQVFTVEATFGCTVKDPVLVVQLGLTDPQQLLADYLLGYHNIMQMGLDFRIDQINEARRAIHDELTAYQTVHPPIIDGLDVRNASIDVIPPDRQRDRDEAALDEQDDHIRKMAHLLNETQRQLAEERRKREMAEQAAAFRRGQEMSDLDHDQVKQTRTWHHEIHGKGLHEDAGIESQKKISQAKLDLWRQHQEALAQQNIDPSDYIAVVDGGLSHADLAELRRNERAALLAQDERRQDEKQEWDREQAKMHHDIEMKKLEQEHERQKQQAATDAAMNMVKAQLDSHVAGLDRDAAERQRQAVVKVISSLADRGHLDMMNIDLEGLMNQLGVSDAAKALEGVQALAADGVDGPSDGPRGPDSESTAQVNEPDVAASDDEPGGPDGRPA